MQKKWILALFFLTGISSLIYEIAWVRQATLTFGVSIYAFSAVLTAYMGGMALGGYLIGRRADQAKHPLDLFAWLQIALAVLGILTPFLLQGLTGLYAWITRNYVSGQFGLSALRLGMAVLALSPPSICIGAMFPLASQAYARRSGQVGGDIGWLYVTNASGSVLGCLLTATILLPVFGLRETIFVAGLINLLVAGLTWGVVRGMPEETPVQPAQVSHRRARGQINKQAAIQTKKSALAPGVKAATSQVPATQVLGVGGMRFVIWSYAVSGFTAMAYEVVWTRLITLYSVGAVYSFSIMLTVFLAGLVVGCLFGTWVVRKWRASLLHFSVLQLAISLLAVVTLMSFARLGNMKLEDFFQNYSVSAEMAFEGIESFITLFPVTIMFGMAFPVVSSLYTAEQAEHVGLKMSRVSALNTAGSILGSLLAGFLIVPALGLQMSIYVLAGLNLAIGLIAARIFTPKSMALRTFAIVVLLAVLSQVVTQMQKPVKFLGYWESNASQLMFYKEGVESTVAVFSAGKDNPKFSTVNGRVEVPTDVLSLRAFYLLGHLPPLLKPDAKNALFLSFGNGIASGTLSTHNIPALDVVELAPEMVDAARQVYTQENRNILEYPGMTVHIEDARNFLLQTGHTFDIITTDATHPSNSSSWTLFTTEFYHGIQQHLTPDGVFLQWLPIHSMAIADYKAILRTYQSVFPNTTLWYTGGSHTLVLATPTRLTKAELEDKLKAVSSQPEVLKDLGDAARIERHWIMNSDQLQQFIGTGRLVTDNNAYFLPINSDMEQLTQMIQQAAVQANP